MVVWDCYKSFITKFCCCWIFNGIKIWIKIYFSKILILLFLLWSKIYFRSELDLFWWIFRFKSYQNSALCENRFYQKFIPYTFMFASN